MSFDQWFEENVTRVHPGVGTLTLQVMKESYKSVWDAAIQSEKAKGDVVVTKSPRGEIVLVSRQDEDGQILSVIAEPGFTEEQIKERKETQILLDSMKRPYSFEEQRRMIIEVRNKTMTSLMSAKHALEKYNWDVENAITYLTKGSAYVNKHTEC